MAKKIEHKIINNIECKWCSSCKQWLPLSEFYKSKSVWDGFQTQCKDCTKTHNKQFRSDNPNYMKAYNKQYHINNIEYELQRCNEYYKTPKRYASTVRRNNLYADRKYGRVGFDEDPLPTIEQYIWLLSQPDHYDGKQYDFFEMGLDRIDNSKPHTIDNVVPCTTAHNRLRGEKKYEEFYAFFKNNKELELFL